MPTNYSRAQVLDIIEREAAERNIPRDDFLRFAHVETGGAFDELASRGPGGAKGLFQFTPPTAQQYGIAGRELDAVVNTDAAARLYLDNRTSLVNRHERDGRPYLSGKPEPDGLDMYLAHQQGAGGYRSLQTAIATGSFGLESTRANILNNVGEKELKSLTGVDSATFRRMSDKDMAQTFVQYWDTKMDRIRIPEKASSPFRPRSRHRRTLRQRIPRLPSRRNPQRKASRFTRPTTSPINTTTSNTAWARKIPTKAGSIVRAGWSRCRTRPWMRSTRAPARPSSPRTKSSALVSTARRTAAQGRAALRRADPRQGRDCPEPQRRHDHRRGQWPAELGQGALQGHRPHHDGGARPQGWPAQDQPIPWRRGVELSSLDSYLERKHAKGVKLYASDPLSEARDLLQERSQNKQQSHPASEHKPSQAHAAADAPSVLRENARGAEVRTLQQTLQQLGYKDAAGNELKADGAYGQRTSDAVKAFQRAHGLQDDGVVGRDTQAALKQAERRHCSRKTNPDHPLFNQALNKLEQLGPNAFANRQQLVMRPAT